jgi:hypothetical protein
MRARIRRCDVDQSWIFVCGMSHRFLRPVQPQSLVKLAERSSQGFLDGPGFFGDVWEGLSLVVW